MSMAHHTILNLKSLVKLLKVVKQEDLDKYSPFVSKSSGLKYSFELLGTILTKIKDRHNPRQKVYESQFGA